MESVAISKHYKTIQSEINLLAKGSDIRAAAIVHLYYTDSWPLISSKLTQLTAFPFDLFVSLPKQSMTFKPEILKLFPNAYIYQSPNRGRDVLPFMAIANILYEKGYKHVLKLHSKKSTHRTDGSEWMSDILNSLIPGKQETQLAIMETLSDERTAMIGPKGQYTSLKVNFESNGRHMTRILTKLYSANYAYDILQTKRSDFGFFAGTMFWVNLKAVKSITSNENNIRLFESESGQIDATYAHAIERILCVLPESEGGNIYEVGVDSVDKVDYSSGVIPDWSQVYIGPKAE